MEPTEKESSHKENHDWSYDGECGPHNWGKSFSAALGKHQSPINIETSKAVYDESLTTNPLVIDYNHQSCENLKNNGHTFQIDANNNIPSTVSGGPVKNKHTFLQFHMHWGNNIEKGSEHLVDGNSYAAELHFVNWNSELYTAPGAALVSDKNDGLIVLGVLIKIGKFNGEFEKLFDLFNRIHLKGNGVSVHNIDMLKLMPTNLTDYWTYPGSLTTPPCSESVQWVVFREPVEISKEQLEKCHHLYTVSKEEHCNEHTVMRHNFRPVCLTGDRVVRKSFKD